MMRLFPALFLALSLPVAAQNPTPVLAIVPVKADGSGEFPVFSICFAVESAAAALDEPARVLSTQAKIPSPETLKSEPPFSLYDQAVFVRQDPASSSIQLDLVEIKTGKMLVKSLNVSRKEKESLADFHFRVCLDLWKKAGWKMDPKKIKATTTASEADAYEVFQHARFSESQFPDSAEALYRRVLSMNPGLIPAAIAFANFLADRNRAPEGALVLVNHPKDANALRALGDLYFSHLNDLKKARQSYQEAIKEQPRDYRSLSQLAVIAYLEKNNDLARQYANQSLSVRPDFAAALNVLGNLSMLQRDTVSATKFYERSAASDRFEIVARKNLARIHEEKGRFGEARSLYEDILRSRPDDALTLITLANLEYQQGEIHDAALHYVMAVLIRPELESASQNPVQILQFLNRRKTGSGALVDLVTAWDDALLDGDLPESQQKTVHAAIGFVRLVYLRQPAEALTDLQIAVGWNPDLLRLHWLLGDAYDQMNQYARALEYYRYYADRVNDEYGYARIHLAMAKTLIRMKRFEDAQLEILKSIRMNPNAESYLYYAVVLRGLRQYESAIGQLEKALRIYPAYLEAYLEIGKTCILARKYDRAMIYYKKAVVLDSSYYPARMALSELYLTLERFEDAESEIQSALRLTGDHDIPELFSAYGNILLEQKKYEEAASWFFKHWQLDSSDADLAYKIAVTFGGRNDVAGSVLWLEKAFADNFTDFAAVRRNKVFQNMRKNISFEQLIHRYEDAFQQEALKRLKTN
ncbi:MAG: tetratricopeptide repeat protein [Bacteroidetes bacterium]|nr:tetratricopeptide repeat protein [Bacteroidota bacterium]